MQHPAKRTRNSDPPSDEASRLANGTLDLLIQLGFSPTLSDAWDILDWSEEALWEDPRD